MRSLTITYVFLSCRVGRDFGVIPRPSENRTNAASLENNALRPGLGGRRAAEAQPRSTLDTRSAYSARLASDLLGPQRDEYLVASQKPRHEWWVVARPNRIAVSRKMLSQNRTSEVCEVHFVSFFGPKAGIANHGKACRSHFANVHSVVVRQWQCRQRPFCRHHELNCETTGRSRLDDRGSHLDLVFGLDDRCRHGNAGALGVTSGDIVKQAPKTFVARVGEVGTDNRFGHDVGRIVADFEVGICVNYFEFWFFDGVGILREGKYDGYRKEDSAPHKGRSCSLLPPIRWSGAAGSVVIMGRGKSAIDPKRPLPPWLGRPMKSAIVRPELNSGSITCHRLTLPRWQLYQGHSCRCFAHISRAEDAAGEHQPEGHHRGCRRIGEDFSQFKTVE